MVEAEVFRYPISWFSDTVYVSSEVRHSSNQDMYPSWAWFESVYYMLVSLTTIGFGDYFMPSALDQNQVYISICR